MSIPTPDQYARLHWHARQQAAHILLERVRLQANEIRLLRAGRAGGRDREVRDVVDHARELLAEIPQDPPHVIAERIREWIGPTRREKQTAAQRARRARQRQGT